MSLGGRVNPRKLINKNNHLLFMSYSLHLCINGAFQKEKYITPALYNFAWLGTKSLIDLLNKVINLNFGTHIIGSCKLKKETLFLVLLKYIVDQISFTNSSSSIDGNQ